MKSEDNLLKVLVVESSGIIRSGLSVTLKRISGYRIQPIEISSFDKLEHVLSLHDPNFLIISPTYWGAIDLQKIRSSKETKKLKVIALVSSVCNEALLKKYDETITLYNSSEEIKEKISSLIENQKDKGKDEQVEENDTLSLREKEILVLVVKGLTNKEIAQKLFLSTHTIITHRRNITRKLEIHSTAGLTVYAIVNKLIELNEIKDNFTL